MKTTKRLNICYLYPIPTMVRYGIMTSFYIQKELLMEIDKCVRENKEVYKSRNSFINAALSRELRRLDYLPQVTEA